MISDNSKSDFYKNVVHKIKYPQGLVIALRMSQLDFAEAFYKKYGQESVLIYSLWDGYIEKNQELQKLKALWENRFIQLHSGGHASADDIKKMVEICSKEREQTTVIPMHLENFNGLAGYYFEQIVKIICSNSRGIAIKIKGQGFTICYVLFIIKWKQNNLFILH